MMYNYPMYGGYQQPYYPNNGAMPDQLAQLRGGQQYQPTVPTTQQPMQQPTPTMNSNIIWVQGEEGAKAYLVAAGNTVQLWDSENPTIYIKSTDSSGMPSMRIIDYTERSIAPKNVPQIAQIPAEEFVTRREFDALQAKFDALMQQETSRSKSKSAKNADNDTKETD